MKFKLIYEKIKDAEQYKNLEQDARYNNAITDRVHKLHDNLSNHYKHINDSLRNYTDMDHAENINNGLWSHYNEHNNDYDTNKPTAYMGFDNNHITDIDQNLHSYKTPSSFSVYSSIRHHFKPHEGNIYHHPGYLSTSIDKTVPLGTFKKPIYDKNEIHYHILHIHVPKNHPGFYIGHHSEFPEEKEFILPRGMKFQHKNTTTYNTGKHYSLPNQNRFIHFHHMDIVK